MNGRAGWLVIATVLSLALLAGFYATNSPAHVKDGPSITVSACESLPDYDYRRMVDRVEQIKGMQLRRNLSICTEQTAGGIGTTSGRNRFAYVSESGLAFFELDPTTNSDRRSSLGHTAFSPSGGPIRIFLANETVVRNVSWISYEGLVAHELAHAIDDSHLRSSASAANVTAEVRRTTDWLLASRAISEGSATYVAERYVRKYGGELNVSKLGRDARNWRHRTLVSVYSEGYRYSEKAHVTSSRGNRVNSTARILHPTETTTVTGFPPRPTLSMDSLERVRTDRIGELFLRETLTSKGVDPERAAAAARGWTNDRMDYYRANGSTVITWRVTWRTADERAEFVETYDAVYDYERVDALGSVSCREPGRYLTVSEQTVTILSCSD